MPELMEPQRLAKRIAATGLCSRREAERWIEAGRVTVNGTVTVTPAVNVGALDKVAVDNVALKEKPQTRLWLYHKPKGLITSHNDPQGRPTVFGHLPKSLPRVLSVGRLDLNSEGLLLLTNDGTLARKLELPATGLARTYRVRLFGAPTPQQLQKLKNGVTVEGVRYGSVEATLESGSGSNRWLIVRIHEGKNREIRRIFDYLGYKVNRLIRIGYGPFNLGRLDPGLVQEVPQAKIARLFTE